MRLFGLIGYPLSHSFSQKYFTEKFRKEEIYGCTYLNFPIPAIDELTDMINTNPGLEGLNVTIPYKEKVISFLDDFSDLVKDSRACNCIKIKNNRLIGHNTDIPAFEKSFIKNLGPVHQKALVLGTGGASKAVRYVLDKLNIPFTVVSRSPGKNEICYEDISGDILTEHKIIINTTPVGMQPDVLKSPSLPYSYISREHYLYDLIYNPPVTVFLDMGQKNGAIVKNGLEMLEIQAELSWQIWNS
jgi:shikimate dehydrogenase